MQTATAKAQCNETVSWDDAGNTLPILPQSPIPPLPATPPEVRQRMIAEAAYYHAMQRGFAAGGELEDWLAAEVEIERLTRQGSV